MHVDPFGIHRIRTKDAFNHPTLPQGFVQKVHILRSQDHQTLMETSYFPNINEVLRPYQKEGVAHLVSIPRFVLGDDTGLGKTVMTIAAIAILKEREKIDRAIIFAPGSALLQWEEQIYKFSEGLSVEVLGIHKRKTASMKDRARVLRSTEADILVVPYSTLSPTGEGDLEEVPPEYAVRKHWFRPKYNIELALLEAISKDTLIVFDEVTALKNPSAKRSKVARRITHDVRRVIGLTATLAKNNVMDIYGIYRALLPTLFPNRRKFENQFVAFATFGSKGRFPVGSKNLKILRDVIDPVYLSRRKVDVAKDLPEVQPLPIRFELEPSNARVYEEIREDQILEKFDLEHYVTALTAVTFRQMATDHPKLLDRKASSTKLKVLTELLETQFANKKVVIFSRFKKMTKILRETISAQKRPVVQVTGDEGNEERTEAIREFTESEDPVVCLITEAGSEAINLQASDTLIFYDLPFSFGTYYQTIGRVHRIGSTAESILIVHLIAEGTVDQHIYSVLKHKFQLARTVADVKQELFTDENTAKEILKSILEAEKGSKTSKPTEGSNAA